MGYRVDIVVDGNALSVDGRDVADWSGGRGTPDGADPVWRERAAEYVAGNPRPLGVQAAGVAAAQRLALLRRLAAGPASRRELLATLRRAGWVGPSDLENRLRELRRADRRGRGGEGVPLSSEGERYWLAEPFPDLDEASQRALGFAKTIVRRLDGPLADAASAALERLLPGLAATSGQRLPAHYRASAKHLERFEAARADRRPVRVRYFSLNSNSEKVYDLVPIEYVTLGTTVKALCIEVDQQSRRIDPDRQFAMDRVLQVDELAGRPRPRADDLALHRSVVVLQTTEGLRGVMHDRNLFAITEQQPNEYDDSWRVRGSFPTALSWDVMELLCAWAGSVQVHEPLWLVNVLCRRLRAGLRVMEEGGDFELVKPEPSRLFASMEEAVEWEPEPATGARKLAPRRRTASD